jgi:hypothetical protein
MNAVLAFLAELSFFDAVGLLGFATYLVGFGALQLGWLDGNGKAYAWANVLGASFVLVSLYDAFNLASAMIQVSWIIIGYVGIVRRSGREAEPGRSVPA